MHLFFFFLNIVKIIQMILTNQEIPLNRVLIIITNSIMSAII